jgi:hypothetical protein
MPQGSLILEPPSNPAWLSVRPHFAENQLKKRRKMNLNSVFSLCASANESYGFSDLSQA